MVFQGSGVIIIMMLHNLRHPNVQPAAPTETFPPSWLAGWLAGWLVVGWLAGWLAFSWISCDFDSFSRIGCHNAPGPFSTLRHPNVQPAAPIETFPPSWLAGWLAGWLVGWLAGWLAGLLFHGFSLILMVFRGSGVVMLQDLRHPKAP